MSDVRNGPRRGVQLAPPPDFRASELEQGGRQFLVMSYELPDWSFPSTLTTAERGVLRAFLGGATHQEVADARGVSPRTIANQLASVFKKLGARSRMELAVLLKRPTKAQPERRKISTLRSARRPAAD